MFSDGITIMGHHPFPWLVDRFFIELTGTRFIEFGYIFKLAEQANWAAGVLNTKPGVGQYGVDDLERDIAKVSVDSASFSPTFCFIERYCVDVLSFLLFSCLCSMYGLRIIIDRDNDGILCE